MSEDEIDAAPDPSRLVFSQVAVARRDLVHVTAHPEEAEGGGPLTYLLERQGTEWGYLEIPWPAPLVAVRPEPDPLVVTVIGVDGRVVRGGPQGFRGERIDTPPRGPIELGWLRGARQIGAELFVVGMSRQAYRRDDGGWARIDAGVLEQRIPPVGFEAVDGFTERDVYAVGLDGEIQRWDGAWRRLDSPTNLALRDLRCVAPGRIFVCGTAGVVLRGGGDHFERVPQEDTEDNLYAIEHFREEVYVAGLKHVYRLRGDALQIVDLGLGPGVTTGHLHAADGVMWSCGARHLAWTADGRTWNPVEVTL